MPSVVYSMISLKGEIVADYANERFQGNFREPASKLLAKVISSGKRDKATYTMNIHTFNYKLINDVWFMCIAEEKFGKQMPFVYLQDVADEFFRKYPSPSTVDPSNLRAFTSSLASVSSKYTDNEPDRITKAEDSLSSLTNILHVNMEEAVKSSTKIDDLADTATSLAFTSDKFKKEAKVLKNRMCWSNIQLKLMVAFVVLFLIYFFVASFCGLNLKYC